MARKHGITNPFRGLYSKRVSEYSCFYLNYTQSYGYGIIILQRLLSLVVQPNNGVTLITVTAKDA